MIRALILGLMAIALAGCATAPAASCPPLVSYSLSDQATLADELPNDGPQSARQIEDYIKLRQACRAT